MHAAHEGWHDDELSYDAVVRFETVLLRYVVEEILFGTGLVAKGVVSAWLVAEEESHR